MWVVRVAVAGAAGGAARCTPNAQLRVRSEKRQDRLQVVLRRRRVRVLAARLRLAVAEADAGRRLNEEVVRDVAPIDWGGGVCVLRAVERAGAALCALNAPRPRVLRHRRRVGKLVDAVQPRLGHAALHRRAAGPAIVPRHDGVRRRRVERRREHVMRLLARTRGEVPRVERGGQRAGKAGQRGDGAVGLGARVGLGVRVARVAGSGAAGGRIVVRVKRTPPAPRRARRARRAR